MSGADPARRKFQTLDGLRGIAALAVAFRHVPVNAIGDLTPESYLAVDLFFVLSGFVLAYAYEPRLRAGMTVADMVVARLIRLYPLFLAASLIALPLLLVPALPGHYHPPQWSAQTIVLGLVFVPQIDPSQPALPVYALVGPGWSLAFEFVVNIVYALIATRLTTRVLTAVVAGCAALLIFTAWRFDSVDVGWAQANLWGGIGRVGFGFFAGVAACRLWQANALPWLRLPPWAAVAAVLAVFAIEPDRHQAARDTLAVLAMPVLVLAAARIEPGRWLAAPFAVLGGASYAVYVLHNPVDQWFETLLPWSRVLGYDGRGTWGAAALIALVFGLAVALDRTYDRPVRARLTARWRSVRGDYHSAPRVLR